MRYEQLLVDMQKLNTAENPVPAASDSDVRQKSDATLAGRSKSPPSAPSQPAATEHHNPSIFCNAFADQTHTAPAAGSAPPDSSEILKQLGTCASAVSRLSSSISKAMTTCSTYSNFEIRQIAEPLRCVHREVPKLKSIERQSASGEKGGSPGIVNNPPFGRSGGYQSGYQSSLASSKEQLLREQWPIDIMFAPPLLHQQQQQHQMQNPILNPQLPSLAPSNAADLPQAAIDAALEDSPKNKRDASEEPPSKRRKTAKVSAPAPLDENTASNPKRADQASPSNTPVSHQLSQGAQTAAAMQGQQALQGPAVLESPARRPEASPRPAHVPDPSPSTGKVINKVRPEEDLKYCELPSPPSPPFQGVRESPPATPKYPSPPAPSLPFHVAAPPEGTPDRKGPWDYCGMRLSEDVEENDEVDELVKRWTTVEV